jgi:D-glycero-D-manno-heptose 1,7-bisphosphate phosphatase
MAELMARGVILDRDGTLIDFYRDPELGVVTPAFHPDHLQLLPGVVEGLRTLLDAGFVLAIATNQPGAAKGELPRSAIERTNAALLERLRGEGLSIATMRACLHHPEGRPEGDAELIRRCDCRKPAPGMLLSIVDELGLDAADSWMVGDTASDLGAARAAGLRCALVAHRDRCELCPLVGGPPPGPAPTLWEPRLDLIANEIVARTKRADGAPG